MRYALIVDGVVEQYPFSFQLLRKRNPDVSYPRLPSDKKLAEYGVVRVTPAPQPEQTTTHNPVEGTPALVDGVWTQTWAAVEVTPEETARRVQEIATRDARISIKADAFVTSFVTMTPAQVSSYIDANVTNLTSAKSVIEKLALMVLLLARREFRE